MTSYRHKTAGIMEEMDLPELVESIEIVTGDSLIEKCEHLVENRAVLRATANNNLERGRQTLDEVVTRALAVKRSSAQPCI